MFELSPSSTEAPSTEKASEVKIDVLLAQIQALTIEERTKIIPLLLQQEGFFDFSNEDWLSFKKIRPRS